MTKRLLLALAFFLISTFTVGFVHFKISADDEIANIFVLRNVLLVKDDLDGLKLTFFVMELLTLNT